MCAVEVGLSQRAADLVHVQKQHREVLTNPIGYCTVEVLTRLSLGVGSREACPTLSQCLKNDQLILEKFVHRASPLELVIEGLGDSSRHLHGDGLKRFPFTLLAVQNIPSPLQRL